MTTHVVLYSGGLDSTIVLDMVRRTLARMGDEVVPVYFDLRQPYSEAEIRRLDPSIQIDDRISWLGEADETSPIPIVSLRNIFMVLLCATMGNKVYFGQLHPLSESTSDGDQLFLSLMSLLLQKVASDPRHGLAYPEVFTPLSEYSKPQAVRRYLASGGRPEALLSSFSCFQPLDDTPCGECNACVNRYVALKLNSLPPGTEYIVNPESTQYYDFEFKRQATTL
ncbi:MAG: 7-cyano-7-deazaguanine synthase [Rhodobacter sp.]|nr:7-cyano-7-deazaguanine synthase [Rhodobacter sp.]